MDKMEIAYFLSSESDRKQPQSLCSCSVSVALKKGHMLDESQSTSCREDSPRTGNFVTVEQLKKILS